MALKRCWATYNVISDWLTKRSSSNLLRLGVVSAVPELLQSGVIGGVEVMSLEQRVQLTVFALVEGYGGAGTNDWLAAGQ